MAQQPKQPAVDPKVRAGGIGAAIVLFFVALAAQFDVEIRADLASAATALAGFIAAYFQKR